MEITGYTNSHLLIVSSVLLIDWQSGCLSKNWQIHLLLIMSLLVLNEWCCYREIVKRVQTHRWIGSNRENSWAYSDVSETEFVIQPWTTFLALIPFSRCHSFPCLTLMWCVKSCFPAAESGFRKKMKSWGNSEKCKELWEAQHHPQHWLERGF